ncbi:alcohol dehydrogenase [Deminuibacter soli]|uniref:alcohol dehydrogenase n=1 Tax=Deminuibacter soli TaxID=2291815 RepID=A0A3E1NRY6_9BACT|nr:alcohol dehydrogenase [Deminuibacter soli]
MGPGNLILFEGPGKDFILRKFPVRDLAPGEILVKNLYTTICGSDLHTYCGLRHEPSPTVLGHEIVGEILAIAPTHAGTDLKGQPIKPGDRITWSIFASNPDSELARAGMPQKSDHLFKYGHALASEPEVFHGGLGDYCILKPHTALLKLPQDLPMEVAATLNCSVATVAGALRMAGTIAGKNVLITGMGHLGITCAAMCRQAGANWIAAADISEKRLEEAITFGTDAIFDLTNGDETALHYLRTQLPDGGVDIVFDMSGSASAMQTGLQALAVGGIAVWIGAVFPSAGLTVDPEQIIRRLLTIRGLHNYNYDDLIYAFDFMIAHWQRYPFREAIEKEFSLSQAQQAFAYAVAHKPLRVGIRI